MRRFPGREELVAAYWQKLTRSIERGGAPPYSKTKAMNGRPRSRSRLGARERSAALRNGKHVPEMGGTIKQHARFHSHS